MKTAIDIAAPLLARAKQIAATRGVTLLCPGVFETRWYAQLGIPASGTSFAAVATGRVEEIGCPAE